MDERFVTMAVPEAADLRAPDGSEIRLLPSLSGGSMVHCSLPPGEVSLAVTHRTVEEIWFVVEGRGQLWRRRGDREEVTELRPGTAVTISLGTRFQFRSAKSDPLRFVIVTMPPWPGADEAARVEDHWPVQAP